MRTTRRQSAGFTLTELLVTIVILGAMAAMLVPALGRVLNVADQTACASNLRQVGYALQQYLKDNDGWFFPLRTTEPGGTLWYFGFEAKGSVSAGEGNRQLDRTRGKLYPYLGESYATVEVCPAFNYYGAYKAKYSDKWWTYGINYELVSSARGRNRDQIKARDQGRLMLFADAAQVNTWQAPATPRNPLVEEWFYVQAGAPMVHFRHDGLANVLMADGHVEALPPAPNSFSPKMPNACIGSLDAADVVFRPRGGW